MPVIAEYRHAGIIAELPAPSHRRDERLARAQYDFEEATKRSGCRRIRPGNQCFCPRFVIPREARYLVISKVAQDDEMPVIRIQAT